jgi:hypothetical protein
LEEFPVKGCLAKIVQAVERNTRTARFLGVDQTEASKKAGAQPGNTQAAKAPSTRLIA